MHDPESSSQVLAFSKYKQSLIVSMPGANGGEHPWWAGRARYWPCTLAAVSLVFALLATASFTARVFAHHKVRKGPKLDDVLMGCAVIFMWAETGAVLLKCYNGVGVPSVELPEHREYRLRLGSWLVAKLCVLSMACCRFAMLSFLWDVFGVCRKTGYALKFLAVFNLVWAIVSLSVSTFSCKPVSFYWNKPLESGYCVQKTVYNNESLAFSVLGLATDLAILITPQPRIWKLQVHAQQKIGIAAVLGVGVIVCIFSLLRCIQFAYFDTAHLSTSGLLETMWTFLENDIAIICGGMPHLRHLIRGLRAEKTTPDAE